jgi:REP element-mobilizing transposase RayT
LGDLEKEQLVGMLWQQAAFSGLEVITHAIMSNHIHVLVRMGDVSVFMKELKQRFSRWYNRRHDRFGTLWAERFKSLLVEDRPEVVQVVAAYVDLNPLRAKSVSDPKDYRWSGYGQAVAGHELARRGLASFHPMGGWELVGAAYRKVLLVKAGRARRLGQAVMGGESIDQELARGGRLGLAEVLRLRVRYFSDGVALGSRNYVEEVFREFRARFGPRRKTGARPLRGMGVLGHLATLRDLRVRGVG